MCPHIKVGFGSRAATDRAHTPTFLDIDTLRPRTNPFAVEGRTLATRFFPGVAHLSFVEGILGSKRDEI